ncbi:MAG: hypothetical protein WEB00_05585 [Dehalococcoidia bacterium]
MFQAVAITCLGASLVSLALAAAGLLDSDTGDLLDPLPWGTLTAVVLVPYALLLIANQVRRWPWVVVLSGVATILAAFNVFLAAFTSLGQLLVAPALLLAALWGFVFALHWENPGKALVFGPILGLLVLVVVYLLALLLALIAFG